MSKLPFDVSSLDRHHKKAFLSLPKISNVIENANKFGIEGTKLVLESSGAELVEDDILEYYAEKNIKFILLKENEEWSPLKLLPCCSESLPPETSSNSNIELCSSSNSNIEFCSSANANIELEPINTLNNQMYYILHDDEMKFGELSSNPRSPSLSSTMSMSSTALSSSSSTNASAIKLFSNFQVQWDKLPKDIIDNLNQKKKLGNRLSSFINYVVDDLRRFSFFIPIKIFRSVAENIVQTYPDSFEQRDADANIISSFSEVMLVMMRNRNNYLNHSTNKMNKQAVPIKKRRTVNALRDSATNWQPDIVLESADADITMENKKHILIQLYAGSDQNMAKDEKVLLYMKECYSIQRLFFNNCESFPTIKSIQENWPYIFKRDCLYQHFVELTGINTAKLKNSEFNREKKLITKYFNSNTKKGLTHIKKVFENNEKEENILKAVTLYFKENLNVILQMFPIGTTMNMVQDAIPAPGVWIAVVESTNTEVAYIFIEKILVSTIQPTNRFSHAEPMDLVMQGIAFCYTFNLQYPKEVSQSLDFFVRFFLNYYPEKPRGPKKNINNMCKINNLILKLNEQVL